MKGCHKDIRTVFRMTVTDTQTPTPGPIRSKVPPDNSSVLGPRAGFDEQVECEIRPNCTPDMRNSVSNCRNKIIQPVRLDNSPSVVYDRVEQFGDILGMIKHWEGMELRENENFEEGGRPRKIKLRKSEEIQRLSTRFEGDDKDKIRLDRHRAEGGKSSVLLQEFQNYREGETKNQKVRGADIKTAQFSTSIVSTNHSKPQNMPGVSTNESTADSTS